MTSLLTVTGQLQLAGATLVALGLGHVALPRALAWRRELSGVGPLNRHVLYTHTFFIGVMCVLLGLAPLTLAADLLAPGRTATAILVAECAVWGLRWLAQFVAFPARTWRDSRLHTAGYVGFAVLWTWILAVFTAALATR
ncbi:hypothetical protein [Dactylosporangium sp. NPDC051541]|uniref:hypothetical protein n=1 Tax=Dactylosporangium sp. NPDC051541 TaxID=3363977 RepID=UPI00378C090B